jgi:rubrerythrin
MSDLLLGDIPSIPEFLAHALEMEAESMERYRQLADNMEVHNNPDVAALFRTLAAEAEVHVAQVKQRGAKYQLPNIAPWDFKWSCPEGPKSLAMDETHYLMNTHQALELALHNANRGRDFYHQVVDRSSNTDVQRMAGEMIAAEESYRDRLSKWLTEEGATAQLALKDFDPPNMPE